jgi:protein-tyrosine phosphatase
LVLLLFPVLAAVLVWLAVSTHAWVWLWPAAVMVATWVVYLVRAPHAFGKRRDGTLAWSAWLVWGPLFAYQWVIHVLTRAFTREPVATEVAPGVWVARRPRVHELPPNVAIVVDLCAEFPAARGIPDGRTYVTIPTLDAMAPTPAEIVQLVDAVIAANGAAFIHCAFGHGRSATVAAAVLIRRGDATLDDVEAKMRASRPRIGLNAHQRAALAAATKPPSSDPIP